VLRRIGRLLFKLIPLWSWRIALYGACGVLVAVGALILGLRYAVLPNIDAYRGHVERAMSAAVGQRITIGEVEADWRGLRPQFTLRDVTIFDDAGRPALQLGRIDNSLAWSSLFFLEPRFHAFRIDQPHLDVRRARDGTIAIAGIELRPGDGGGGLVDWVLRQPAITISRASVSWLDEVRQAPELKLEQVSLALQNDFHRHRFGLKAQGTDGVLGALDLRGDLAGMSVRNLRQWEGQFYLRLEDADLAAHSRWIDLPIEIKSGRGAVRVWVDVAAERVTAVTADVHVAALAARLAPDLQPLEVDRLTGRVGWRALRSGFEVFARSLTAVGPDGHGFHPLQFNLRRFVAQDGKPPRGEIKANALDLGALANFAEHLPLEPGLRAELARYAPQGTVSGLDAKWTGTWPLAAFDVRARFDALGVAAVGSGPGLTNISGSVEATEKRGTMTLANRNMQLELPRAFAAPLKFDALSGQVTWTVDGGRYDIRFADLRFANPDLEGSLQGTFHTAGEGYGSADLTGALIRADARRVAHYLPLVVGQSTRDWVREAVVAGYSNDVKWRLKGDLAQFPFASAKEGTFEVLAKARGGVLEYAPGWPRIENIAADIRFAGKQLEVSSNAATILGARLSRVRAVIPDLEVHYEVLDVAGEAEAPTTEFLRFIEASPVAAKIDRFTDGMQAQGLGRLTLQLTLPLRELERSRVAGSYWFAGNTLRVDSALPPLEKVDGRLQFTEDSVSGRDIEAQIFGGPARIAVDTREGGVIVTAGGRASVEALRRDLQSPLMQALSGSAEWRSTLEMRAKLADFVIESDLTGVASTLPAPFAKTSDTALPLRIERRAAGAERDSIRVSVADTLSASIARRREGQELAVESAAIGLGQDPPAAEGAGLWIKGTLPHVDADRWRALLAAGPASGARGLQLRLADVELQTLEVFGRTFHDVLLNARQAEDWRMRVAAREFNGDISWQPQDKGRIVARLQRLVLPQAIPAVTDAASAKPQAEQYPALDITVEDFRYKERALGRLVLNAIPEGRDWRIERLEMRNPDAVLTADGYLHRQAAEPQTRMNLRLEVADIGKYLARMNYPQGVRGGVATVSGTLGWNGPPLDIDYPTLSGEIAIDAARGQFAKLDPGIGKLLSILSLQALPRRVSLDFKDVFSEGFAFDSIQGKVRIQRGIASTESFRINGSAARVVMSGDVDLDRETQKLKVRVTPSIGDSVATVTALLGGPVAGIGVFLAQKLLNDPLGQLIAYDYSVTGTWSDPTVSKIAFERSSPG
jgi:uncharacterized protein (TIGR02099 family)